MTYRIIGHEAIQPINVTETVKKHALGTIFTARDDSAASPGTAGEFIYLSGVASTVIGTLVTYDPYLGTTTLAPATGGIGPVAVAMSANVAGQFGFYQIGGVAAIRAPNAMTPGAQVFMLAATPGSVDDAQVNGEQVVGAVVSTTTGTPSTGLAYVTISRPFLQGQIV
jgi:hypothetical protein